jgi:hypothetical protein
VREDAVDLLGYGLAKLKPKTQFWRQRIEEAKA